jgi:hypothetical protein
LEHYERDLQMPVRMTRNFESSKQRHLNELNNHSSANDYDENGFINGDGEYETSRTEYEFYKQKNIYN